MSETSAIERLIDYIVQHNAGVIEALIAAIMITALFLSYRALTTKAGEEVSGGGIGGGNLKELEETMQKILEKASMVPSGAAVTGGGVPSAEILGQIETLKKNLEEKQAEIATLRETAGASSGISSEAKSKLEGTIRELQDKLAEYEIISEDIADLSFYKEENVKLQKQIESLKSGSQGTAVPAAKAVEPAVAQPPTPAPVSAAPASPPPVQAPAPAAPPPPGAAAPPASQDQAVDDDLMAEFAKAIEDQRLAKESASAAPPAAPKQSSPPATPSDTAPPALEESMAAGLDIDKMVSEAANIGEGPQQGAEVNALEVGVDENKLISEASALESSGEKVVMDQFEKFVKKGES